MSLSRAWQSFCQQLFEPYCEHANVHSHGEHCPDCGDRVQLLWTQVRCRDCGARRKPKAKSNGQTAALTSYCRFCGSHQIKVLKKHHIERHELPYSLLSRETDYSEQDATARSVFRTKRPDMGAPEAQAYQPYGKTAKNPFAQAFQSEFKNQSAEDLMVGLRQFMNDERESRGSKSTFRSVMDVDLTRRGNPFKSVIDGDVLSSEYLS